MTLSITYINFISHFSPHCVAELFKLSLDRFQSQENQGEVLLKAI